MDYVSDVVELITISTGKASGIMLYLQPLCCTIFILLTQLHQDTCRLVFSF